MLPVAGNNNMDKKTAQTRDRMIKRIHTELRGVLKHNEPMSQHTTWRTGGSAKQYFEPADLDDLRLYLASLPPDEPLLWIGSGSNLLVRDGGYPGSVIAISRGLNDLKIESSGRVKIDAGVACARIARLTVRAGFSGAEFLAGIPGVMGGALAMNAGAFGGETWDLITSVRTINRHGKINTRCREDFQIAYRAVAVPDNEWFISAEMQLAKDPDGRGEQRIKELLDRRSETQPIGQHSCGSVFRNPPGDYAARLIDACGLKGMRIGNACISEKHANFIVNLGGAKATDIEELIHHVQETVRLEFSISLVPEVKFAGIA